MVAQARRTLDVVHFERGSGQGMSGRNLVCSIVLALAMLDIGSAMAQDPAPPDMSLAAAAARRFPQPVNVGSLIGRTVLQPLSSRPVLGHVAQVVRSDDDVVRAADGVVQVVMSYGGLFGIGSRLIAVPVDAMVLLGDEMEVVDFKPEELDGFPTFDAAKSTPVAPTETISVGLARPSH